MCESAGDKTRLRANSGILDYTCLLIRLQFSSRNSKFGLTYWLVEIKKYNLLGSIEFQVRLCHLDCLSLSAFLTPECGFISIIQFALEVLPGISHSCHIECSPNCPGNRHLGGGSCFFMKAEGS